jgi:antitoxin component of MazEF toxin-antitoxin module
MIRSVFKSGNSLVVALPGQLLDELALKDGSEVDVVLSESGSTIEISPVEKMMISPDFARKVDEFIQAYRPALESLSQR